MRAIVTITPPTPNGDLHLGHLSGPFLAADVCARTLRQAGVDTLLLSYSDDYQSYLLRKGRQENTDPYELAERNAVAIEASMRAGRMQVDHFMHAYRSQAYLEEVEHYVTVLERRGLLARVSTPVHRCDACNVWGYEGFGRGHCNYCGSASDASQCENCARAPLAAEMTSVNCVLCGKAMRLDSVERLCWRIGSSFARLQELYALESLRPHLRDYLRTVLTNDSETWAISRPGDAAIPSRNHPEDPIHTWFAGLAGYKATLREHLSRTRRTDELSSWWSADTKLVHFMGFDCSYSHAVAYRSLLEADDAGPKQVHYFSNRFLTLDGEDFSTSRNHAIWIRDITRDFPPEAVRLYVATISPEHEKADFSRAAFEAWYDNLYRAVMEAAPWEAASDEDFDQAVAFYVKEVAPHVQDWYAASRLENFSLRGIGQASQSLLALAAQVPAARSACVWAAFAHVAAALCPSLARTVELSVQTNAPRVARWVAEAVQGRGEEGVAEWATGARVQAAHRMGEPA